MTLRVTAPVLCCVVVFLFWSVSPDSGSGSDSPLGPATPRLLHKQRKTEKTGSALHSALTQSTTGCGAELCFTPEPAFTPRRITPHSIPAPPPLLPAAVHAGLLLLSSLIHPLLSVTTSHFCVCVTAAVSRLQRRVHSNFTLALWAHINKRHRFEGFAEITRRRHESAWERGDVKKRARRLTFDFLFRSYSSPVVRFPR